MKVLSDILIKSLYYRVKYKTKELVGSGWNRIKTDRFQNPVGFFFQEEMKSVDNFSFFIFNLWK